LIELLVLSHDLLNLLLLDAQSVLSHQDLLLKTLVLFLQLFLEVFHQISFSCLRVLGIWNSRAQACKVLQVLHKILKLHLVVRRIALFIFFSLFLLTAV